MHRIREKASYSCQRVVVPELELTGQQGQGMEEIVSLDFRFEGLKEESRLTLDLWIYNGE